jgi:hypothetical protein
MQVSCFAKFADDESSSALRPSSGHVWTFADPSFGILLKILNDKQLNFPFGHPSGRRLAGSTFFCPGTPICMLISIQTPPRHSHFSSRANSPSPLRLVSNIIMYSPIRIPAYRLRMISIGLSCLLFRNLQILLCAAIGRLNLRQCSEVISQTSIRFS